MKRVRELEIFAGIVAVFLTAYFVPFTNPVIRRSGMEALLMLQEYARHHVLLCLVPAFFIAGAIAVFISQASVIKYLGPQAKKSGAYGVASVSGAILTVCSCTVLPLFASIHKRGAGLGPAIAFLYSGPAINVLAIILTARVLGIQLGLARAIGAVLFSILIGLAMHLLFRREETAKRDAPVAMPQDEKARPLWKTAVYIAVMVGILVFANWGTPSSIRIQTTDGRTIVGTSAGETATTLLYKPEADAGRVLLLDKSQIRTVTYAPSLYTTIYHARFYVAGGLVLVLLLLLRLWFARTEVAAWGSSSWSYAKLILPYLFAGVLVAGFLLGRPGHQALIPAVWISRSVGGNSFLANAVASVAGAFMYFATLTEVPILQGLQGAGMGNGPALALLLAGPALSLPNMLVIRKVIGTKKTIAYVSLVVIAATLTGKLFGFIVGS